MAYEYAEKYLWDIPVVWNKPGNGERELISLRRRTPRIASAACDIDAIIDSEMGRQMVVQFEDFIRFGDEMDPVYLQKWEDKGLRKEMHERENFWGRWAVYTPVSAFRPENRARKYPLLFVLHGGGMPINWEECSGFLPIAAQEKLIVCLPQDHSVENILRIYEILKRDYPVDVSRVYSTGYSQGSVQTNALMFSHPELLAAVAPCGCLAGLFSNMAVEEEAVQAVARLRLPTFIMSGQQEGLYLVPYYEDAPAAGMYGENRPNIGKTNLTEETEEDRRLRLLPPDKEYKVASLNLRLRASNCPEVTMEQVLAARESQDIVCRKIGMPFTHTEVQNVFGWDHYIGTVTDKFGDDYLKIVTVENFPHWPIPSMAQMAWDFMKHFSRDPGSGALVDDRK